MNAQMNTNEFVWVKLTKAGLEHYEENARDKVERGGPRGDYSVDDFFSIEMSLLRQAECTNGFYEFQLWRLMNIFGPKMTMGLQKPLFEKNAVYLKKPLRV